MIGSVVRLCVLLIFLDQSHSEVSINNNVPAEQCELLDGIFVSVMRRIFSPGYHKELLSEVSCNNDVIDHDDSGVSGGVDVDSDTAS